MTKIVSLNEISIQTVIALARNGDEIIIEENGQRLAKVVTLEKPEQKPRIAGLGKGKTWMSADFDDELPDEFWDFDK